MSRLSFLALPMNSFKTKAKDVQKVQAGQTRYRQFSVCGHFKRHLVLAEIAEQKDNLLLSAPSAVKQNRTEFYF